MQLLQDILPILVLVAHGSILEHRLLKARVPVPVVDILLDLRELKVPYVELLCAAALITPVIIAEVLLKIHAAIPMRIIIVLTVAVVHIIIVAAAVLPLLFPQEAVRVQVVVAIQQVVVPHAQAEVAPVEEDNLNVLRKV